MKTIENLISIKEKMLDTVTLRNSPDDAMRVVVGLATCGIAAGSRPVLETLVQGVADEGISDRVSVVQTGCIGICQYEPVVEVYQKNREKVTYVKMNVEKAKEILESHLKGGVPVMKYTIGEATK